ncbi:MAG: AlpA family phage regulatory protein [Pseudomonas sp.]|nr:MAG: AlpA family phage regulatory protein [Pseudomonas sp.]
MQCVQPRAIQNKVLRVRACLDVIGISRSTLFDITNPKSPRYDSTFPTKIRIGSRAVGWLEADIYQWLISKQVVQKNK